MHAHRSAARPLLALGVAAAVLYAAVAAREAHGGGDRPGPGAPVPSHDASLPERTPT